MKNKINKIFNFLKKWFNKTAKPFLKNNWMQIVNLIVLFVAYDTISDLKMYPWTETILGLWVFILLIYYIFWKLFGVEKMFNK